MAILITARTSKVPAYPCMLSTIVAVTHPPGLLLYAAVSLTSVEVQLVGDRKNTRVEQRILHLDAAAPAIKLVSSR